jgi:hypothetical protein
LACTKVLLLFALSSAFLIASCFVRHDGIDCREPQRIGRVNVCLAAGGGLTLGFWSNKNGQASDIA